MSAPGTDILSRLGQNFPVQKELREILRYVS
jgi:hypothetical protein